MKQEHKSVRISTRKIDRGLILCCEANSMLSPCIVQYSYYWWFIFSKIGKGLEWYKQDLMMVIPPNCKVERTLKLMTKWLLFQIWNEKTYWANLLKRQNALWWKRWRKVVGSYNIWLQKSKFKEAATANEAAKFLVAMTCWLLWAIFSKSKQKSTPLVAFW